MGLRTVALDRDDEQLLAAARSVIAENYEYDRHHIGAAVRMSDGQVFVGVHVEAHVGRVTLCAEAVALGTALSAGARGLQTIVAVAHPHADDAHRNSRVVSPCGMCRELILDFGPNAWVIVPWPDATAAKVAAVDLLPQKYARHSPPAAPESEQPPK